MKIVPYEKVEKPLVEYISFLMNVKEGFVLDKDTPETIDRKRKALHDKVCEAFGITDPDDRNLVAVNLENVTETDVGTVAWNFWTVIADKIGDRNHNRGNGVKTRYREKAFMESRIKRCERRFQEMMDYCMEIFNAFNKDRREYNDRIDNMHIENAFDKGLYCFTYFEHDFNGAAGCVRRDIGTMKDFATHSDVAYTEAAVRAYVDEPLRRIETYLNKMAAQSAWCQMYHSKFVNNETKFKFREG